MNIKYIFEEYYNGQKNFMTPDIYGYSQRKFDEEYLLFEKSSGEGFENEKIYGASALVHNHITGDTQKIELSECFDDPRNLEVYIKKITKSDFENADRYGEIKKI